MWGGEAFTIYLSLNRRGKGKMTSVCRVGGLGGGGARLRKKEAEMGTGQGVQCSFTPEPVRFAI